MIIAFASDAVLLLWDPQRRAVCTKGGTQKLRLAKLGSRKEAVGADEGKVKAGGEIYGGLGGVQALIRASGFVGDEGDR